MHDIHVYTKGIGFKPKIFHSKKLVVILTALFSLMAFKVVTLTAFCAFIDNKHSQHFVF